MKSLRIFKTLKRAKAYIKSCGVKDIDTGWTRCDCRETVVAIHGKDQYGIEYIIGICDVCGYNPKHKKK